MSNCSLADFTRAAPRDQLVGGWHLHHDRLGSRPPSCQGGGQIIEGGDFLVATDGDFHMATDIWQPATCAASVEGLRVHDLRHTAGTLATAAGGSLREVMDRLGHSTTVAAVRYQHVMADRDAAIARELNRLIEGA